MGLVRACPRRRSGNEWPPARRWRAAGVTAEGMRGRASHFLGVTAVGMQGTASLSEVIPAAGEAGEPGANGIPSRHEAGVHRRLHGCHACAGRRPVSAGSHGCAKAAATGLPPPASAGAARPGVTGSLSSAVPKPGRQAERGARAGVSSPPCSRRGRLTLHADRAQWRRAGGACDAAIGCGDVDERTGRWDRLPDH